MLPANQARRVGRTPFSSFRLLALLPAAFLALSAFALTACIDFPSDEDDQSGENLGAACGPLPYFSILPVPEATIDWADVIGRLGAPSQTLPKGHTGLMLNTVNVPIVAPGDMTIERMRRVRYLASPNRQGFEDYALFYRVCKDVTGHFGHVITLDSNTFADEIPWSGCSTYNTADETVEMCEVSLSKKTVTAGEPLGTASAPHGMALDMGLVDRRVTHFLAAPDRYPGDFSNTVCPFEYYDAASQEIVFAKMTDFWQREKPRTGTPRCGTLEIDVAGSAQGSWSETTGPLSSAEQHRQIALANNPYWPQEELVLSMGPATLGAGTYRVPRETTGRVNRVFADVTADAGIHCYHASDLAGPGAADTLSWLVALQAGGSLQVERVAHGAGSSPCDAAPATWAFGINALVMVR